MTKYKRYTIIDGKSKWVIVDGNGNIINKYPSKEEMKDLKNETYVGKYDHNGRSKTYTEEELLNELRRFEKEEGRIPTREDFNYNPGYPSGKTYWNRFGSWSKALKLIWSDVDLINRDKIIKICCNCESHHTYTDQRGYENWRKHECQKLACTGYLCTKCYNKYDPNSLNNLIKSLANRRIGTLDPNSDQAKADRSQKLACVLHGWVDLNKKYDNYTTPIDCYDPKTGLYHQIQGRYYNYIERNWLFGNFKNEWEKKFATMVCFCFSKDGKIVERIYKFPKEEIIGKKYITLHEYEIHNEKYRETNENELINANNIWKKIINK